MGQFLLGRNDTVPLVRQEVGRLDGGEVVVLRRMGRHLVETMKGVEGERVVRLLDGLLRRLLMLLLRRRRHRQRPGRAEGLIRRRVRRRIPTVAAVVQFSRRQLSVHLQICNIIALFVEEFEGARIHTVTHYLTAYRE